MAEAYWLRQWVPTGSNPLAEASAIPRPVSRHAMRDRQRHAMMVILYSFLYVYEYERFVYEYE